MLRGIYLQAEPEEHPVPTLAAASTEQTRTVTTSRIQESQEGSVDSSASSADTEIFVGGKKTEVPSAATGQEPDIMQISKIKIEEREENESDDEPCQISPVRIEVDEGSEAERISDAEGNEFIMHAEGVEQTIAAEEGETEEGINPSYEAEPESVGEPIESPRPISEPEIGISSAATEQGMNPDMSEPESLGISAGIEEPAIEASKQETVESYNPNYEDEPETVSAGAPVVSPGQVSESEVSATVQSVVQGMNPDVIMEPEPIDDHARIEGPDVTDTRIVSTGAQEVEADLPPAVTTSFHQEEVEVTTESAATRQQITMKSEVGMSPTTPPGRSPSDSDLRQYSPAEVTITESAHEASIRAVGKYPSAVAETLAEVGHDDGMSV